MAKLSRDVRDLNELDHRKPLKCQNSMAGPYDRRVNHYSDNPMRRIDEFVNNLH